MDLNESECHIYSVIKVADRGLLFFFLFPFFIGADRSMDANRPWS